MNQTDLEKTLKYFHRHQIEGYPNRLPDYDKVSHAYWPAKTRGFFYNDETDFCIALLVDDTEDRVYQVGTEANTVGVELKTFEELCIRYKSFTGEELI